MTCQVFGQTIRVKIDRTPPEDRYWVRWFATDGKATILINTVALKSEYRDVLIEGLIHDLFEIACWTRGIYDSETEGFSGFGHVFYAAAIGRAVQTGTRLYNKLTRAGGKKVVDLSLVRGGK